MPPLNYHLILCFGPLWCFVVIGLTDALSKGVMEREIALQPWTFWSVGVYGRIRWPGLSFSPLRGHIWSCCDFKIN